MIFLTSRNDAIGMKFTWNRRLPAASSWNVTNTVILRAKKGKKLHIDRTYYVIDQQAKMNKHSEWTYLGVDIDGFQTRIGLETGHSWCCHWLSTWRSFIGPPVARHRRDAATPRVPSTRLTCKRRGSSDLEVRNAGGVRWTAGEKAAHSNI